jgi:hypothetical protein
MRSVLAFVGLLALLVLVLSSVAALFTGQAHLPFVTPIAALIGLAIVIRSRRATA